MFAGLGRGWSNAARGDAIKRVLVMEIHRSHDSGRLLEEIGPNIGEQARPLYEAMTGKRMVAKPCYVCGGRLDEIIKEAVPKAKSLLEAFNVNRFVVGAVVDPAVLASEEDIKRSHGLEHGESIKAEIRREVVKALRSEG